MQIKLKKGLDLPLQGSPQQRIDKIRASSRVAVLGADFIGLKPKFMVKIGDRVQGAQPLFLNKHNGLLYPSPASGQIVDIKRGPRRSLLSVEIEVDDSEPLTFRSFHKGQLGKLAAREVKDNLLAAGLWTVFRARPFGQNPGPDDVPHSIFISAMDTNPLAVDPTVVIGEYSDDFGNGLRVLSRLFPVPLFLCKTPSLSLPEYPLPNLKTVNFIGPHPAGQVGTHIHHLDPVDQGKSVWHLGYQDLIAIGKLFTEGRLWTQRIVSLAGSQVVNPRLLKVSWGAHLGQLLQDELLPGHNRIISGSVLSGRAVAKDDAFLGRYHTQIVALEESAVTSGKRPRGKYSRRFSHHALLKFFSAKKYRFTTEINGDQRPMFPLGDFERLVPLDILPTPLLRALLIEDDEEALALGCLELEEEDLALCTYACVSKIEYGKALRNTLNRIAGVSE